MRLASTVAATLLLSASAGATEPSVLTVRVEDCLSAHRESLRQLLSLELGRPVQVEPADAPSSPPEPNVMVHCRSEALLMREHDGPRRRQRLLDVSRVSDKALARTVALAVVALLETPEPELAGSAAPRPTTSSGAKEPPRSVDSSGSVGVLATTRLFPGTSDISFGARLRSRLLSERAWALLLGVGAERGNASRDAGTVDVTALSGDLGVARDLGRSGPFAFGLELVGQAGYVSLRGQPRLAERTSGGHLNSAWIGLGAHLVPRWAIGKGVELALGLGGGVMLLSPSATHDEAELSVWRGTHLGSTLGLSLAP